MSRNDILKHSKNPETIARLKRLAKMPDSQIDFSDIPEATPEQLRRMRPASEIWKVRKKQVTLRVDADVLAWFQASGKGYLTRMNDALRATMLTQHGRAKRQR
jgi:uncharacterized protein (DUF4415 family)